MVLFGSESVFAVIPWISYVFSTRPKKSVWSTKWKYILKTTNVCPVENFIDISGCWYVILHSTLHWKCWPKSWENFSREFRKNLNWCKIKFPTYLLGGLEWRTWNPKVVYFSSLVTLVWMIFLCLNLLEGRADLRKWKQKVCYVFYILYSFVKFLRFSSVSRNTVLF